MTQITIEYMIMIPLMITQIFLFPLTASWIMNTWVDTRQTLALKEITSHISSSIQQVYSALTHASLAESTVTIESEVPGFIEGHIYFGNATFYSGLTSNSSSSLEIRFMLVDTTIESRTRFPVGDDFSWQDSTFTSNSEKTIIASKLTNGTIVLSFGGI